MYRAVTPADPVIGDWAASPDALPERLKSGRNQEAVLTDHQIQWARRAFYALCTHIDHQIRVVVGTLAAEGLLDDTVICFTADHGDMLANHRLWGKALFYEESANVPMLLVGAGGERVADVVAQTAAGLVVVKPGLLRPVKEEFYVAPGEAASLAPHVRPNGETGAGDPAGGLHAGYGDAARGVAAGLAGAGTPRPRDADRVPARIASVSPPSPRHESPSSRCLRCHDYHIRTA